MNRLRDFFYNVSDILLTLVIIAAALLLISWRVSAIMDYGTTDNGPTDSLVIEGGIVTHETDAAASDDTATSDTAISDAAEQGADAAEPVLPESFQVTITDSMSSEGVASALVDAGVLTNRQDFLVAASAAGAETKLRSGTFTIPAGSSPEQIVTILTSA